MEKLFWPTFFYEKDMIDWSNLGNLMGIRNHKFIRRIRMAKANDALRMKIGKSTGTGWNSHWSLEVLGWCECMMVDKHFY